MQQTRSYSLAPHWKGGRAGGNGDGVEGRAAVALNIPPDEGEVRAWAALRGWPSSLPVLTPYGQMGLPGRSCRGLRTSSPDFNAKVLTEPGCHFPVALLFTKAQTLVRAPASTSAPGFS